MASQGCTYGEGDGCAALAEGTGSQLAHARHHHSGPRSSARGVGSKLTRVDVVASATQRVEINSDVITHDAGKAAVAQDAVGGHYSRVDLTWIG